MRQISCFVSFVFGTLSYNRLVSYVFNVCAALRSVLAYRAVCSLRAIYPALGHHDHEASFMQNTYVIEQLQSGKQASLTAHARSARNPGRPYAR